jgi:HSP20 family protein
MIVIRRGHPRGRVRRSTETDELFRALVFGGNAVSSSGRGTWRPPTEVYETGGSLEVVAELAGMEREEIEVLIEGDVISIRGVRPDPAMCDQRSYHEARISYGQFAADINVPFSVDGANATATYENGFLRISLPREPSHTLTPRQSEPNQESEDDVQG